MQRIAAGFNRLAPFYTIISTLVFGKKLKQAERHFLAILKPNDRVLILGGGSGNFLQALLQRQPDVIIDYIDISSRMIALAKKKTRHPSNVNFIIGTEENIPTQKYSSVITNFYLDLFSDKTLQHIVQKIKIHVQPDAQWLATDFISQKRWHKILLWIMYRFFRVTTGIEASRLPDWQSTLQKAGMQEIRSKKFYCGFIKSSVYQFVTPLQG